PVACDVADLDGPRGQHRGRGDAGDGLGTDRGADRADAADAGATAGGTAADRARGAGGAAARRSAAAAEDLADEGSLDQRERAQRQDRGKRLVIAAQLLAEAGAALAVTDM